MSKIYAVYIMASMSRGALYIGMSGQPQTRVAQNKGERTGGSAWALRHYTRRLVHIEFFESYPEAREREVKLKTWKRQWKIELVEKANPEWRDLTSLLAEKFN